MARHSAQPVAGSNGETGKAMDRILVFSDAIFAFAITLLVVTLDVPNIPSALAGRQLIGALLDQAPRFASYALSFWLVAIFWMAHHRTFQYIVRFDGRLIQLNLLLLFAVGFLPYPVELLGKYGDQPVALTIYTIVMAVIGFASTLMWTYAVRHRMLRPDTPAGVIQHFVWRGIGASSVFVLSAIIAWVNLAVAYYGLFLIAVIQAYLRRRYAAAGLQ